MQSAELDRLPLTKPEEITGEHDTSRFTCGRESLDDWLKSRALKSNKAGDSKVFVVCKESGEVVGYYAISAGSVSHEEAISKLKRNAPNPVPIALIGRLAVHEEMKGQQIGSSLLRDAILRIAQASEHLGIRGILVHALDAEAGEFYLHHGFHPSPIDDNHLMISLKEVSSELSK